MTTTSHEALANASSCRADVGDQADEQERTTCLLAGWLRAQPPGAVTRRSRSVASASRRQRLVFANLRGHHHAIARGATLRSALAGHEQGHWRLQGKERDSNEPRASAGMLVPMRCRANLPLAAGGGVVG